MCIYILFTATIQQSTIMSIVCKVNPSARPYAVCRAVLILRFASPAHAGYFNWQVWRVTDGKKMSAVRPSF